MEILKRYKITILLLLLLLPTPSPATSQQDSLKFKIKAVFLYNFLNYITWPGEKKLGSTIPATICIYKNAALEEALSYVKTQKASEKKLIITNVQFSNIPPRTCHMLFISNGSIPPAAMNILLQQQQGVLLVSDTPGFVEQGGMIELVEEKERVTFNINNSLMTKEGFYVSSRLLSIAKEVR